MLQQVPRSWGELLAMLAALGAAIGTGKLLAMPRASLSWRRLQKATIEGAALACGGIVPLFWFPDAHPAAVFGLGVVLAALGLVGLKGLLKALWGRE